MATKKKKPGSSRPTKAQLAAQEERRRRERRNRIITGVVVAALVVGLGVIAVVTASGEDFEPEPIPSAAVPGVTCTPDTKTDSSTGDGPHVKKAVKYEVDPPSGGDHSLSSAAPGIYDAGKVDDFKVVHALEHGYVAIWYRPGISDADLAVIENIWKNYQKDVLIIERPSLPATTPVAATAWHDRLLCSGVDGSQLGQFVRTHVNNGPEKVPHTAVPEGRDPRT